MCVDTVRAMGERMSITHLFVYGTLRPGDVRWHFLEPFVVDEGWVDAVPGQVFDTGVGYPAALFDDPNGLVIHGRTYALLELSIDRCLDVLDREEQSVTGGFHRVPVATASGRAAWAYQYAEGLDLTEIPSGDWLSR